MAKVLIVDDESDICQLISRYAVMEGHETEQAYDGLTAVELCRKNDYDIIIMDAMMPELDGFSACKKIKKVKDIPVIMLSARGEEYDKLFGFEVGVDDYVVKPFSPKELLARINVVISRHQKQITGTGGTCEKADRENCISVGKLEINIPGREVHIDGMKVELTAKEYDLLRYLAENRGIVLSREMILNEVWGYEYGGADRTVDWQIKLLRNHLGKCRDYIVTLRGIGYKFEI